MLIPVNPAEPAYESFIDEVIPLAVKKGMGIVAMKVYLRGFAVELPGYTTMEPFYRFALSQPVTTAVIGCDTVQQLEENVRFAQSFSSMPEKKQAAFIDSIASHARKLMYYKP